MSLKNTPSSLGYANVFLRHVLNGHTWCLLPITVLDRTEELVVLRISCGSEWLAAYQSGNGWLRIADWNTWELRPKLWSVSDLTYLIPFGDWCAYGMLREPDCSSPHLAYINFQKPLCEESWGFETLDLELDLVARLSAGRRSYSWEFKDLDRFNELVELGVIDRSDGHNVKRHVAHAEQYYDTYLPQLLRWCAVPVPPPSLTTMLSRTELAPGVFSPSQGGTSS